MTGIQYVGRVGAAGQRGSARDGHHLLLFRDDLHRMARVVDWVRRGLDEGEKVLYTQLPGDTSLFRGLTESGVDVDRVIDEGRLSVLPLEEFYPADGQAGLVQRQLDEGFPAVRLSATADAALSYLSPDQYHVIEQAMDQLCASLPVSALCQYAAQSTTETMLASTVETHPSAVDDPNLRYRRLDNRISLAGEMDASSVALVELELAKVSPPVDGDALTLDLSALRFIGVAGCRALLLGTEALRTDGVTVFLEDAQPHVRNTMELLGVGRMSRVFLV